MTQTDMDNPKQLSHLATTTDEERGFQLHLVPSGVMAQALRVYSELTEIRRLQASRLPKAPLADATKQEATPMPMELDLINSLNSHAHDVKAMLDALWRAEGAVLMNGPFQVHVHHTSAAAGMAQFHDCMQKCRWLLSNVQEKYRELLLAHIHTASGQHVLTEELEWMLHSESVEAMAQLLERQGITDKNGKEYVLRAVAEFQLCDQAFTLMDAGMRDIIQSMQATARPAQPQKSHQQGDKPIQTMTNKWYVVMVALAVAAILVVIVIQIRAHAHSFRLFND